MGPSSAEASDSQIKEAPRRSRASGWNRQDRRQIDSGSLASHRTVTSVTELNILVQCVVTVSAVHNNITCFSQDQDFGKSTDIHI